MHFLQAPISSMPATPREGRGQTFTKHALAFTFAHHLLPLHEHEYERGLGIKRISSNSHGVSRGNTVLIIRQALDLRFKLCLTGPNDLDAISGPADDKTTSYEHECE